MDNPMDVSLRLRRDGHRLLQAGALLFLLGLLVGLAVQRFAAPRLGLSTHLLGIMQGIFLMVAGSFWSKLGFSRAASRIGCVLALYGCLAAWTANLLGAIWGAGHTMLPIAAGAATGGPVQERVIEALLRSAAVSLICVMLLILWGLRRPPTTAASE